MKNLLKSAVALYGICSVLSAQEPSIPTFDMREFYDLDHREEFIEGVQEALHEYGFFALSHTGIDEKMIQKTFDTSRKFFQLPYEQKMKISGAKTNSQRGYIPMYQESAKGEAVADQKEFLHIGRERDSDHAKRVHSWPNMWPDFFDLKTDVAAYRNRLDEYTKEICHILALALEEKENYFDEGMEDSESLMRIIHYPPASQNQHPEGIWAAAHTDIDLFTILPQATADGLEVQMGEGEWLPVRATEDSMIINGGDFLEVLSNGYFKSAVHRVKAPESMPDQERLSIVYFAHPKSEFLLSPRPQWIEKTGGVKKYADATRWEMLMERLADLGLATEEMLKELADCQLMERLMEYKRESVEAMRAIKERGYASEKILKRLEEIEEKKAQN